MKKLLGLALLCSLSIPAERALAQEKAPEKLKVVEKDKPAIPIRVQVVFTEFDGEKKISSMPYTFLLISDERFGGHYSASVRTGIRIPIEIDGKDAKTQYMDIGTNIDCGANAEEDGRYRLFLVFDRSALYPNKSTEGERLVSEPNGQPIIRQFRTSENLILKDGQTSDNTLSTDPLTGHVLRVSVTMNLLK